MERAKGFEPTTLTLARLCSTPELRPRSNTGRLGSNDLVDHCRMSSLPAAPSEGPNLASKRMVPRVRMAIDRKTLFARLEELGIASTTVEHAPMFTVEQSAGFARQPARRAHQESVPRPTRTAAWCWSSPRTTRAVDLKALAARLGLGRLSFGKAALLEAVLGVPAGSVTPFALAQRHGGEASSSWSTRR